MTYSAALIGCGRIGAGTGGEVASHASGYQRDGRIELVAAADPDAGARQRVSNLWGVERLYDSYEKMFVCEEVDFVSICSWDPAHAGAVRAAVAAGVRAIFCEKPLAPTAAGAAELAELCDAAGVGLLVGYQRCWDPAHRAARDYIAAGKLGEIQAVNGYYVGGLRHNGCAWINLARYLVGEIGAAAPMAPVTDAEATVPVRLDFQCGATGSLLGGDRDAFSVFEIDVVGTAGRIRFSDAGETLEVWDVEDDPHYPEFRRLIACRQDWPQPQMHEALNFAISGAVDWLDGSGDNPSSGHRAAGDMTIVEAILAQGAVVPESVEV